MSSQDLTSPQLGVRHPWRFALLVMLALQAVLLVCLGAARFFLPDVPLAALDLPILLINAVVGAVIMSRLSWWRAAGFRGLERPRDLLLMLFPVVVLVTPVLLYGVDFPPLDRALVLVVMTLLIAFQEEAIFRGGCCTPCARSGCSPP